MQARVLNFPRHYGTLACFILMLALFTLLLPNTFLTFRNLINISQQLSMLAVVAFGMTVVMAMGDFDLSVGSMASLSGIVAAMSYQATGSVSLCLIAALLTGLTGGAFNGWLVSFLGILPFVATLGTLTIFGGLAFIISGGVTIFGNAIPAAFAGFARNGVLGLPNLTVTALVVLAVIWWLLEKRSFGRHLYAMGGGGEAARLAGVPVQRLRLAAFGLSGLGAAIAGLMYVARVASANPIQGSGLMLDAIAAVFLGMTMSRHGEPRVLNSLIGALFLGVLGNGLTQLSVNSYIRDVLVGAIILAAVTPGSRERLRRN